LKQSGIRAGKAMVIFPQKGKVLLIALCSPPPNITGSLHMGHGFQHTLMDALIRYKRMTGNKVLWQPGIDHAGISTQMVVERQLEAKGEKRTDYSRTDFVDKIWDWKEESGSNISSQLRRMGSSLDWDAERFTMDKGVSDAVLKVFIELYDEGLIYRGERLVNWDPILKTAISDLEVLQEEEQGTMWHIKYPIANSDESIVIATTRPETLLGDTAVAINPNDTRYAHLIGKEIALPLCDRKIPIIQDDYVDVEFGTGCVKITPAHDFNDYEIGKRHNLPFINILNKDATLNDNVPKAYQTLDRFEARKKVLLDLESEELLIKTEPHTLKVPRGEKTNAIIEPYLTKQWYVKIEPLARPAIDAVKKGDIKFIPESWDKTYYQWMENIEDWCISRQLWWGHRIPAYFDENDNIYVGYSEKDVRFKYRLSDETVLRQDEDVLDTWFSSALWPFSSLGWPENDNLLEDFYPTSVLVTGFDIIFFWVARMIMMGLKFMKKVPFKEVYITGLIRDNDGKKMSKSKGNVLDPIDIIDGISLDDLLAKRTSNLMLGSAKKSILKSTKKDFPEGIPSFGTDALRFTYCALATPGRNIRFDLSRVEGYRNFCNKIWNAARYVLMNTEQGQHDLGDGAFQYSPQDSWILSRLQATIEKSHRYFAQYRFDLLASTLYEFLWHEFCDWYLELSKPVLYDKKALAPVIRGTRRTLLHVLESSLRLLHPLMPFITEEIWQKVSRLTSTHGDSIMVTDYPEINADLIDVQMETEIDWLKKIIQSIRTIRSEMNIPPSKPISIYFEGAQKNDLTLIEKYKNLLQSLTKTEEVNILQKNTEAPLSATALAGNLTVHIPLEGLIDLEEEKNRIQKEITKMERELGRTKGKLNNEKFISRAPEDVIQKEKARAKEASENIEKLNIQLKKLSQDSA
jgi:valyl-tRNA synthetase